MYVQPLCGTPETNIKYWLSNRTEKKLTQNKNKSVPVEGKNEVHGKRYC